MSFRSFSDATGSEWQVFDVTPTPEERRSYDRRSGSDSETPALADRRTSDRRLSVGRARRVLQGWLCFEQQSAPHARRRLMGIPENWRTASDEELMEMLTLAKPATATRQSAEPGPRRR